MPKPKPDQVIRHEFVLGSVERKLLDDATTAYQVNRISTPLVALLSDVSAMVTLLSILATYLGFKYELPQTIYGDVADVAGDFKEQYDKYKLTEEYLSRAYEAETEGPLWEFIKWMFPVI